MPTMIVGPFTTIQQAGKGSLGAIRSAWATDAAGGIPRGTPAGSASLAEELVKLAYMLKRPLTYEELDLSKPDLLGPNCDPS
jgi:hypothetical protein